VFESHWRHGGMSMCRYRTFDWPILKSSQFHMIPVIQEGQRSQSVRPPTKILIIRGPFVKFVDSPYYSELELCGGAVTVSFSKYLPGKAMHFLQRSTHFSKTCCRPLVTSKFFASELLFHRWKSPEIAWGRDLN
jgi:hypothetical protein